MLRQSAKALLPPTLRGAAREFYLSVRRFPDLGGAYLHPWRRESLARLGALRDSYRGRRAFIVGNGPSLRRMQLSQLRSEFTFGLNRIYLMFPELGFPTSCLLSVNDLVVEQSLHEMQALSIPRFLSWRSRRFLPKGTRGSNLPTFLYTTYESPKFAGDASGRLWEGATVTYVALQLAFHMGFQQVVLIGVDHHFTTTGRANQTVTSAGDDPNHFSAKYFGKGFRWQLPDLDTSETAYALARDAFQRVGREVLDATLGGRLTIFPKVDYRSLFQ